MARRAAAAPQAKAPEAGPKDAKPPKDGKDDKEQPQTGDSPKAPALAAVMDGHLALTEVVHLSRVMSARGGPWSEAVVAASVADQTISKMMASGLELVTARHVTMVPDGIFMSWLLGKPKGKHSGLKEVQHVSRTIRGNLGAVPPALSTTQANEYIRGYLEQGWSLINAIDGFQPLSSDPSGLSVLWVLVR